MLLFTCVDGDCDTDQVPTVRVFDAAGVELTGSVVESGVPGTFQWLAWKPAQPFAAASSYYAQAEQGVRWDFDTNAEMFDPSTLAFSFEAKVIDLESGEIVCCDPSPNQMWCYGRTACFQKQRQQAVSLTLSPASLPPVFDFLYRTTFRADSAATVLPDQPGPVMEWTSQTAANEYCYAVDAVRILTGELIHVADGCQTLAVSSFAVRAPTDDELRKDLSQCARAPAGYEADYTRLGFLGAPSAQPSDAAMAYVDADAGSASSTYDAGSASDAGPNAPSGDAQNGCALSRGQSSAWGLQLVALGLVRCRRRRARVERI